MSKRKAVFLDRDGVLNRPPPEGWYVTAVADLVLLPGAADAIARLNHAGFVVLVVTNQRCIARGIISAETVAEIHERLLRDIQANTGRIDRIYVCPHDDNEACDCRKPKPGMLRRAEREFELDLPNCWMVGDQESDVQAGRRAGCRTIRVNPTGHSDANYVCRSLPEAVNIILAADAGK